MTDTGITARDLCALLVEAICVETRARARDEDRLRFLEEQNKAIGAKLLDAQAEAVELRHKLGRAERLGAEEASKVAGLRQKIAEAEAPLSELWQAADHVVDHARGGTHISNWKGARDRLRAALKAAEPYVDLIPF